MYSSEVLKQGLLDKSGPAVKRAIRRLNHQAKKRDGKAKDKERYGR